MGPDLRARIIGKLVDACASVCFTARCSIFALKGDACDARARMIHVVSVRAKREEESQDIKI